MKTEGRISIGPILKRLRKSSNHPSLDSLSKASGLSLSYLSLLERDKREPTLSALNKISGALGVPLPVFFLLLYAESTPEDPENSLQKLARITKSILETSKAEET
jgi:transcriptional regulator with XRE-family HTH domain